MLGEACTITISGTVQGVGFRPFVFRTAKKYGILGSVYNTQEGVIVRAYGDNLSIGKFIREIETIPPPLSHIDRIQTSPLQEKGTPKTFLIISSKQGENPDVVVAKDTTLCEECRLELINKKNRRFEHPFINCTQCGPRYSIIKNIPYDRRATSMEKFDMCAQCRKEYSDPGDRRFHAQPICCNNCGPKLTLLDSCGNSVVSGDILEYTVNALLHDSILAIKGIGGFHLACRADSKNAVARLRMLKKRPCKPLAVMVSSLETAHSFADISAEEESLLMSPQRPIVTLRKKKYFLEKLCEKIAPALHTIGVMLPSSPLHYLLMSRIPEHVLVMTSGNISGEVLCSNTHEAIEKLGNIADLFLVHDRPIHMRIDDSVIRVVDKKQVFLRYARGYVPQSFHGIEGVDGCVALGGIQKSSIGVGRKKKCYLSQYLGNADYISTLNHAEKTLDHLTTIFSVHPNFFIIDSHPQNPTKHLTRGLSVPVIQVQHHHAHAAACMGENKLRGNAISVVFDGAGWGEDKTVWGGEFFVTNFSQVRRTAHLKPFTLPGGDSAVRYPGRIALAMLYPRIGKKAFKALSWMNSTEQQAVVSLVNSHVNCPLTSSMGRLFDCVSALLGICKERTYEGQPAIELESVCDPDEDYEYEVNCFLDDTTGFIHGASLIEQVWIDCQKGTPVSKIAARFHNSIASVTAHIVNNIAACTGIRTVVLSGGCFGNAVLLKKTIKRIRNLAIRCLFHRTLPPGDECVAYGQLLIAAARRNNAPIDNEVWFQQIITNNKNREEELYVPGSPC